MLSGSSRKLKSRLQIAIGGMWFCILTMLSHRQGFDDVEQLKQKALEQARLTNRAKDILSRPKSQKTPLNAISPSASSQKATTGAPQGHADQEQNSATAILKGQAMPAKPSPSKSGVKVIFATLHACGCA
jgi:hypothetical protein